MATPHLFTWAIDRLLFRAAEALFLILISSVWRLFLPTSTSYDLFFHYWHPSGHEVASDCGFDFPHGCSLRAVRYSHVYLSIRRSHTRTLSLHVRSESAGLQWAWEIQGLSLQVGNTDVGSNPLLRSWISILIRKMANSECWVTEVVNGHSINVLVIYTVRVLSWWGTQTAGPQCSSFAV